MTTQAMRAAGIILLVLLIDACTKVGHIQRTEPVRMTTYAGSYQWVAQCVQQRIGGRTSLGGPDRLVVASSIRSRSQEGVTHYSVTVGKAGEKGGGFAELRVVNAHQTSNSSAPPPDPTRAINDLWKTVEACGAESKAAAG